MDVSKGTGEIFCMGNALLDMTFYADKVFVEANDLKINDACNVDSDRFKTLLENVEGRFNAHGYIPGGGSQNTARTTQWVLPGNPGLVTYMGATCTDRIGNLLKEKATHSGINCVYETVDDPTGCCLVIVSGDHNENRSLVSFTGGASKFSSAFLKNNWSFVEKAKFFYTEGFFLPTCFDSCQMLGKYVAGESTKRFGMNLSAPYICTEYKDKLVEIMPFVDYLFGNAAEYEAFGKAMGWGEDLKTIAINIAKMPKTGSEKRCVIITRGSENIFCSFGGEFVEYPVTKVPSDRVVDRNGAGDAFVGGFFANLYRGKSVEECAKLAAKCAEISMGHLGCTFPLEKPCLDKMY